jgi:hypothetical protein
MVNRRPTNNAYTALTSIDDLYPREGSFWLDPRHPTAGETPTHAGVGDCDQPHGGTTVLAQLCQLRFLTTNPRAAAPF